MLRALIITNRFGPEDPHQRARRMADRVEIMKGYGWEPYFLVTDKNAYSSAVGSVSSDNKVYYALNSRFVPDNDAHSKFRCALLRFIGGPLALGFKTVRYLSEKFLIPDSYGVYIPALYFAAKKIIRNKKIRVIVTMNTPFSLHLTGFLLKRSLHIGWLAEFRDGWVTNPRLFKGKVNRLHRFLERKVVEASDRVVWNYGVQIPPDYFVRTYPNENPQKFLRLPSPGFDGFYFSKYGDLDPVVFDGFTITYAGSFFKDILRPDTFFRGLKLFIDDNKIRRGEIRVNFFGHWFDFFDDVLRELGLNEFVFYLGRAPYDECLRHLAGSDVNLAILRSNAPGDELHVPAKFVDYICVGKPVLTLAEKENEARKFVERHRLGLAVSYDPREIANAIGTFYGSYRKQGHSFWSFHQDFIEQFDSKNIFQTYCSVLNDIVS
jgi:hypothetical protein